MRHREKKAEPNPILWMLAGAGTLAGGTALFFAHLKEQRALKLKKAPLRAWVAHLLRSLAVKIEKSIPD